MVALLLEESSFLRVESEIKSICPGIKAIMMNSAGKLSCNGSAIAIEDAKPDMAWLNLDVWTHNLVQKFTECILRAGSVKWMQTYNAGLDRPFYLDIFRQGVRITKSDAQAIAISEYVVSNVMAVFQGIFQRKVHQNLHQWQKTSFRELWRTHWLMVGLGNIGQEIAKRVKCFDCKVTGVRRTPAKHPHADSVITLAELPTHLPQADVVVLSCSLNEQTRRLADKNFFQAMKQGSVFVNIARGALVDHAALIAALGIGIPRYAVLDAHDPEPLPEDSPLWELENTIVTPHSSNAGSGTRHRGDLLFIENFRRFMANEPLINEAVSGKDLPEPQKSFQNPI